LDWNLNSNQLYKYKVNININENQILQITIHISIITTLIKILQVTKELWDYKMELKEFLNLNLLNISCSSFPCNKKNKQ
jgi:hypothetical protein